MLVFRYVSWMSLLGDVAEEEHWRLIAIRILLWPGHVVQQRTSKCFPGRDGILEVDERHHRTEGYIQYHNCVLSNSEMQHSQALSNATSSVVRDPLRNPVEFSRFSTVEESEILDTLISLPHWGRK